jgi:hypothetical protein
MNELQSLQNAADTIGLTVHESINQDKRKTVKKYFLQKENTTHSPVLPYKELNHFILGYRECSKVNNLKN